MNERMGRAVQKRDTLYWFVPLIMLLLGLCAPRSAAASGQVIITEFMAVNDVTLADEDGDYPDWIEIYNSDVVDVNLDGWYLTDDDDDLAKWQFPAVTLVADSYLVVFASDKDRAIVGSELHTSFKLKSGGEYLALVEPDGTTIAWEYAPEYPLQFEDVSYGLDAALNERYFTTPTPGSVNGSGSIDLGPIISDAVHTPYVPAAGDTITVSVTVEESLAPVVTTTIHNSVMYGITTTVPMFDDGAHGDGAAGDNVYGAAIPGSAHQAGEMVRYYITATDTDGHASRWPLFHDPTDSPEYFGTMIADPTVTSTLPILYWFVEDPAAAETGTGTRASVFYLDGFYDNVFVRVRGGSSAYYPRKSFKFDFNKGYYFRLSPDIDPVEEINLNSAYSDKAYIRQTLAFETYRDIGSPYSISFPMRVQQNGAFYGVHIFVEQPDERYLERQGLDPVGALYKMYNPLTSATKVGKRTRLDEDHSDLQALIDGVNLPDAMRTKYLFDNVNIPSVISYLAATTLIHDMECGHKNHYLYRDTEGTGEWMFLPWDKDLSFGRNFSSELGVLNDEIRADDHPLLLQFNNHLVHALYDTPLIREMYLRRLRTVMDELLQSPATPAVDLRYEQRIDELFSQMESDVALDAAAWPVDWGEPQTFAGAVDILKTDYLAARRVCLYDHYGPGEVGLIPAAQPATTTIDFGLVVFSPVSGNQDEEYFTLVNPNDYAVDVSGWTISGDVEYVFQPGVVIPAGGTLYVSPDVVAFRSRATSPTGGESHLVQGDYDGWLSNGGGVLELYNADGILVGSTTFELPLSPYAGQLIVTELNYHPSNVDEEFIELKNVAAITLSLDGFQFTEGISYTFPATVVLGPGEMLVLIRDEMAFTNRYPGVEYVGVYDKNLDNGGETIVLVDYSEFLITLFEYGDTFPWPEMADGDGYTLVRRDPPGDANDPCHWRASANRYGSPGEDDPSGGVVICDAAVEVEPGRTSTLQFTDEQGREFAVYVPSGAVTEAVQLVFIEQTSVASAPVNYLWAQRAFNLGTYRDGTLLPDFVFRLPLTLTVDYADEDVNDLQESTLALFYWDGVAWQDFAGTYPSSYQSVRAAINQIELTTCHLSAPEGQLGLFAKAALFLKKAVTPLTGDLCNPEGQVLTYTLTLSGIGLDVSLWDPLPANVQYVDGSVTPPGVYSATARAIVWQGTLPMDTVHTVQFQVSACVTGTISQTVLMPVVNVAWLTDTSDGRFVSAAVIFNAWNVYLPLVIRGN
jgi:hypothetical protein